MAYLFEQFWFEDQSRVTGVWVWPNPIGANTEAVVIAHLIDLGEGQDGVVESDFLSSHLPFAAGGLHGIGPDGSPWVLMFQIAPVSAAAAVSSQNAFWPLVDGMDRALHYNVEAQIRQTWGWTRDGLLQVYSENGIDPSLLDHWTVIDLTKGLTAEACNVGLTDIVEGKQSGCAFAGIEHDCQGDVFNDVFARWMSGNLTPSEPEPVVNSDDRDVVRADLERRDVDELRLMCQAFGYPPPFWEERESDWLVGLLLSHYCEDEDEGHRRPLPRVAKRISWRKGHLKKMPTKKLRRIYNAKIGPDYVTQKIKRGRMIKELRAAQTKAP